MSQYFSFQWHITDECDQRCKHCYIFSGEGCKELKSMTWKQMTEVVTSCEDFCKVYGRVPYFYITGGDPILHPDFWKLMVLLKSKKIPFTLMGNPFHLNDEICRMLKVCGCEKYQMSLDGMRETHDWFRKPGSFDLTIEKIGCLNRAGIKSVIMSTVSKTNMDEIPDIIDEVVKAKAKVFAFSRYVPTGGEVDTSMTPEEYRKLLEVCDAKYKAYEKAGCETYFNKKDHLWTLYEYETGQFKLPESTEAGMIYGGCNCGNCHITIIYNIKNAVIIYRNNMKPTAFPRFPVIKTISFRHIVKTHNTLFYSVQLATSILRRLQFVGNIFINVTDIIICLICNFDSVNHRL